MVWADGKTMVAGYDDRPNAFMAYPDGNIVIGGQIDVSEDGSVAIGGKQGAKGVQNAARKLPAGGAPLGSGLLVSSKGRVLFPHDLAGEGSGEIVSGTFLETRAGGGSACAATGTALCEGNRGRCAAGSRPYLVPLDGPVPYVWGKSTALWPRSGSFVECRIPAAGPPQVVGSYVQIYVGEQPSDCSLATGSARCDGGRGVCDSVVAGALHPYVVGSSPRQGLSAGKLYTLPIGRRAELFVCYR